MIRSAKSGSALVATILMLAILLVLSLLYTVQVRLEGRITEFQQAGTQARGGLHSAQAEAMRDIAATYSNRVYAESGQELDWHSKGDATAGTDWVTPDTATELGWPDRLRETGSESLYQRAQNAGWTVHGNPDEWHLATAWVAADLTGLLDPNVVGRSDALDPGPAGIQMTDFNALPSVWEREYLTPGELIAISPGIEGMFFPDTWSVDRGWYDEDTGLWKTQVEIDGQTLSMFPMDWEEDQVRTVMAHLYPDQDADELTNAFLDFREVAEVPRQVDGLTAIPIPMFNEVFVGVTVTRSEERTDVEVELDLELWLPSVGNVVEGSFRVSETPAIVPEEIGLEPQDTMENWTFESPGAFTRLSMRFVRQGAPLEPGETLTVQVPLDTLSLEREIDGDWVEIDRVPADLLLELPPIIVPGEGGTVSVQGGVEVLDPRLNHRRDLWRETTEHSLGELNAWTVEYLEADEDLDPPYTHTATLDVASNIRFFPVGAPWRSVDLFGPDGRWWLRHTRDSGWEPGRWRRGVVNPNSLEPKVVESVFLEVPTGAISPGIVYPDSSVSLDIGQTDSMALDMIAAVGWENEADFPEDLLEGGTVQRGDWTWALRDNDVLREEMDRHQAEAVVAFVQPRFESASQIWGMILVSEWRSPQGVARARARAVSVIWRDPYADENGRHAWSQMHWMPLP